jgi:RNA polymerase sigma-70 factor (ECF subfamily)
MGAFVKYLNKLIRKYGSIYVKLKNMEELSELSDEELVDYVRTKDQEVYRVLVLRYQEKLIRYAKYLTRDEMKAADVVQNSFIKAYINLNNFKNKLKFSSWVYRIVHNEAVNELKRYKNELPILDDMDFESNEGIENDFIKKEEKNEVRKCLSKLPLKYSEPLTLLFLEEKSYEEISDILQLPIGTVGTRVNRAKKLMKKICQTN